MFVATPSHVTLNGKDLISTVREQFPAGVLTHSRVNLISEKSQVGISGTSKVTELEVCASIEGFGNDGICFTVIAVGVGVGEFVAVGVAIGVGLIEPPVDNVTPEMPHVRINS